MKRGAADDVPAALCVTEETAFIVTVPIIVGAWRAEGFDIVNDGTGSSRARFFRQQKARAAQGDNLSPLGIPSDEGRGPADPRTRSGSSSGAC